MQKLITILIFSLAFEACQFAKCNLIASKYGTVYNEERKKRKIPIIEEGMRFIVDIDGERYIYSNPLKSLHVRKIILVNSECKINSEEDIFESTRDQELIRYVYNYDSREMRITLEGNNSEIEKNTERIISTTMADSIITTWK